MKLKQLVIIFCLAKLLIIMTSCQNNIMDSVGLNKVSKLDYRNENLDWRSLPDVIISSVDKRNIKLCMDSFSNNPIKKEYDKLLFFKILNSQDEQFKYYLFHVKYMEDIIIIYQFSEKENMFIDKFKISSFQGA